MTRVRTLCAWVLLLIGVRAQTVLFTGPSVDAVWSPAPGRLLVQSGVRLFPFDVGDAGARAADGRGWALPTAEELARAEFFDVASGCRLLVQDRRVSVSGRVSQTWQVPAGLFREPISGPPVRLPLVLPGDRFLLPSGPTFQVTRAGAEPRSLPIRLDGAHNLGYGVGDYLEVSTRVPWILPCGSELLVGGRGRYRLLALDGPGERDLAAAPFDAEDGLLDIPFAVPPVLADLDGRPGAELVLTDPSAGAAILYGDLATGKPSVTRVVLVGGHLLGTWILDLDADGRNDLVLLKTPPLNPLSQLQAVRRREVPAELLVYRGGEALVGISPALRRKLRVPLRIGIRNGLRRALIPMLVVPWPKDRVLLLGGDDNEVRALDLTSAAKPETVGFVRPGPLEAAGPFGGVRVGDHLAVHLTGRITHKSGRHGVPGARVVLLGPF